MTGAIGLIGGAIGGASPRQFRVLVSLVMGDLKPALSLLTTGLLKLASSGVSWAGGKALGNVAAPGAPCWSCWYDLQCRRYQLLMVVVKPVTN